MAIIIAKWTLSPLNEIACLFGWFFSCGVRGFAGLPGVAVRSGQGGGAFERGEGWTSVSAWMVQSGPGSGAVGKTSGKAVPGRGSVAVPAEVERSGFRRVFGSWQPRGVVFDCDGLLMDTESLWILSQRRVSEAHGVDFDEELRRALVGLPASRIGPLIAARAGSDPAQVIDELLRVNMVMVAQSAVPMPGAVGFVTAVCSRVAAAVASNSARRILDAALLRGDFGERLNITVSADEVARPKPAPDVYLAAAAALDIEPRDCLAFEDSEAGVESARSAGMRVIAVPSPGQHPRAHLTCESLDTPGLLGWVRQWRQSADLGG